MQVREDRSEDRKSKWSLERKLNEKFPPKEIFGKGIPSKSISMEHIWTWDGAELTAADAQ